MSFPLLSWLFAVAITIHNLEEALWLPEWSQSAGRWHHPVGAREFRFAVGVLTALAYVATGLSVVGGKETVGAYFIAGYALAMLMNVFFPHLLATLIMRQYTPGTATALLLNLPITVLLLYQGFQQSYIRLSTFVWAGPLGVQKEANLTLNTDPRGGYNPSLRRMTYRTAGLNAGPSIFGRSSVP